ncbi:MAG: succinate dehydrogenase cytochrome b subunit [Vicinamibacterales bacterium]
MTPQKAISSSIGSKFLIALTGFFLFLFLVAHLAGNLLFIAGPDAFNEYSHALISNPLILVAEAGLVVIFLLHIFKTVTMFAANRGARPERYAARKWARSKNDRSRKSLSSTTMILTGTITLLFVVTHLATFKFGPYYETTEGIRDLYRLQLAVFSDPTYVLFYLVCMAVIGFHLWHGISSAAQSFGLDSPQWTPRIVWTGRLLTALITAGFALLPVFTFVVGRN